MKKLAACLLAAGIVVSATTSVVAKPVALFEDPEADATFATNPIPGDAIGVDMTGGTVDKKGKDLVWTVSHSAMPEGGTPGEVLRFLWHFDIKDVQYRWTVKSLDIGKPDLVAQSGTERVGQVYQGVARLEECYVDATLPVSLSQCTVVAYYDAVFDAATATMTWNSPLADLKLKAGSTINPGTGGATAAGCQICWVFHYAERSLTSTGANSTTVDTAIQTQAYKVPK